MILGVVVNFVFFEKNKIKDINKKQKKNIYIYREREREERERERERLSLDRNTTPYIILPAIIYARANSNLAYETTMEGQKHVFLLFFKYYY